jgi:hypothetical protein
MQENPASPNGNDLVETDSLCQSDNEYTLDGEVLAKDYQSVEGS